MGVVGSSRLNEPCWVQKEPSPVADSDGIRMVVDGTERSMPGFEIRSPSCGISGEDGIGPHG